MIVKRVLDLLRNKIFALMGRTLRGKNERLWTEAIDYCFETSIGCVATFIDKAGHFPGISWSMISRGLSAATCLAFGIVTVTVSVGT